MKKKRASSLTVLAIGALLLSGCQATASESPTEAADQTSIEGPHLVAAGQVFDPVAHDVDNPEEACGSDAGRTELAEFDRVEWPDLGIDGGVGVMTCGNAAGAGFRHIADGHTGDFGEIADLVDSSWEDVAWFAIDMALEAPSEVEMYRDDIANYLIVLEYVDEGGEVVQSWPVVVGVGLDTDHIITSFPRD
ncbi:hypothetical protein [Agrococcus casei]|uniref:hypothetical protein n=1 Tax=Agrococcus casei TaxID=343512 RepID=UPI003F9303C8